MSQSRTVQVPEKLPELQALADKVVAAGEISVTDCLIPGDDSIILITESLDLASVYTYQKKVTDALVEHDDVELTDELLRREFMNKEPWALLTFLGPTRMNQFIVIIEQLYAW